MDYKKKFYKYKTKYFKLLNNNNNFENYLYNCIETLINTDKKIKCDKVHIKQDFIKYTPHIIRELKNINEGFIKEIKNKDNILALINTKNKQVIYCDKNLKEKYDKKYNKYMCKRTLKKPDYINNTRMIDYISNYGLI